MIERPVAVIALAGMLLSCQLGQPPTTTPTATPPTPSPTATPSPTTPVATQTTAPTATATELAADPCAGFNEDNPARPPDVVLAPAGGGQPVVGRLGSYTYCDTAADALPPRAQNVAAVPLGDPSTVALSVPAGEGFVDYRAVYWPASVWQGDATELAAADLPAASPSASFAGPPAGDWMLAVNLTYDSGGDATWYWHVTVP